jgi:excisionase family DNA binding protein
MTHAELLALPVSVDLWPTAGRAHGISRSHTYELARRGELPFPILRVGKRLRVTRADLLRSLGVQVEQDGAPAA